MILDITPKIQLREIDFKDASVVYNTIDAQRDYLGQWLPFVRHTQSQSDTEAFITSVANLSVSQRELIFTIWYNGDFAGLVGFKATDRINSKTELGYWLSEPFQKKGIVTLCVGYLCSYAFKKLVINRVQIKCAVGNDASRKVPKRLGFAFEGIERAGERVDEHTYYDLEIFSKLKND
ncbi:GNAT family N-acetyltransferase [Carboxylicivirga sp. A043]|uniref:GNAT family N-acetyltransferase n=1 Tax=Carboxylicivirga litoralis TaxID=2816963 RepID=UPI0021CB906C|nr:GNAT family protein [Carboxylicivirga sp. A043]MCU4155431.1 GNAT family N-acetyltransferase [Carboxylicivirga sp. A043]